MPAARASLPQEESVASGYLPPITFFAAIAAIPDMAALAMRLPIMPPPPEAPWPPLIHKLLTLTTSLSVLPMLLASHYACPPGWCACPTSCGPRARL